jgi:uncharacterized RDD family membrane protein YckC
MQKTIEITTTQNVTIEYELAELRERMLAWLLDLVIVVFGYLVLVQLFSLVFGGLLGLGTGLEMILALMPFVTYFLYQIFFEIWALGQTPGKKALNIRVIRLDGKDPEWGDVVIRSILHMVDTLFSAGVIGILFIKTTDKSQRLGDLAAHTTVVKIYSSRFRYLLKDILNISSLDNYQPVYPQVRNLNEQDMLFIKTVLSRRQRYPNQAHDEVVEDLVSHLMPLLEIEQRPLNRQDFLRTILRDYIVLTR